MVNLHKFNAHQLCSVHNLSHLNKNPLFYVKQLY